MATYKADILIVDDTPDNLKLLSQMLVAQRYKVRSVTSGPMALKAAKTAQPDLVLLDILMPELDGYEVCQRLKQQPETSNIPVIFLSALDEAFDKVRAFQVGGIDRGCSKLWTLATAIRRFNLLNLPCSRSIAIASKSSTTPSVTSSAIN